jgi:hypothetical protein
VSGAFGSGPPGNLRQAAEAFGSLCSGGGSHPDQRPQLIALERKKERRKSFSEIQIEHPPDIIMGLFIIVTITLGVIQDQVTVVEMQSGHTFVPSYPSHLEYLLFPNFEFLN